jgi:phospholipid/cholesterol/gamma-HCH transport system substrate-binding protein
VGSRILQQTKDDFAADFKDLFPVIKAFNDNADAFVKSLEFLPTFPFHYQYLRKAVRGDYLNVFVTFDLTLRRLGETVFTTSLGLDPNMKRMHDIITPPDFLAGANANLSGQAADPFKIPAGTATQHQGAP